MSPSANSGLQSLDLTTAFTISHIDHLHKVLLEQLHTDGHVLLDLSSVEECDAAGLQLLCSLRKTHPGGAHRFVITAVSPALQEIADVLGIPITAFIDTEVTANCGA